LNQLTKFAFARTGFGAVRGRVRNMNTVESIKLIRPSDHCLARALVARLPASWKLA
jgi:hypothetical protein